MINTHTAGVINMANHEHNYIVGKLTYVPHGAEDGTGAYYFEIGDGEYLSLKFNSAQLDHSAVPFNESISLCISWDTTDGFHIVCENSDFFTPVEHRTPRKLTSNATDGRLKKHIGVFKQLPPDATGDDIAKSLTGVQDQARGIERFYRYYGHKVWDVQVRGYVMLGEASCRPPYYGASDVSKYIRENDMEGFEPNYFHVNGSYSSGYCGQGNLPGYRSVTYLHYVCGMKTMLHELGHNFGLHHSNTRNSDGSVSEYKDITSIMGSGQGVTGLNSVNLVKLGLVEDRQIKYVNNTQQILLTPMEIRGIDALHSNEYQHGIVKVKGIRYHISLRKTKGAQYHVQGLQSESRLYVHQATSTLHSILESSLRYPGSSVELPGGITVEYLEYEDETARINVIYNDDPKPKNIVIPRGFPKVSPRIKLNSEHSGSWYDPEYNGEGIVVNVKGDTIVLYWYTYNSRQTSRRFYYGTGKIVDGVATIELNTPVNGTWEDPTVSDNSIAGSAQFYIDGDGVGVFNWNMKEQGRDGMRVIPTALTGSNPSSGDYYQPSRKGEGFNIQYFEHLNSCAVIWYSYGPKVRRTVGSTPYDGITEQRWYLCSGERDDDGTYTLKVYEALDNRWMELRECPGIEQVGAAKLTVIDEDNVEFKFNIDTTTVTGDGVYNLTKIF